MLRIFLLFITLISHKGYAQNPELFVPQNVERAYLQKTRSLDGQPGINYWQNRADYDIQVELNPKTRIITGSELIKYYNSSPDTLHYLVIHLFPNVYKKGNSREFDVQFSDETDGVQISRLTVDEKEVIISSENSVVEYIHNDIKLYLNEPLLPQTRSNLSIDWHYTINRHSHMRTGAVDSSTFFIAYFFPRIAVYDDIDGWNEFKYSGIAEFYNDFGNFDVAITVPQHFVVWGTGTLLNAAQVLNTRYSHRFLNASNTDNIVHIIDSTEFRNKNITIANEKNTWKFSAENVTDFAFAISDHYLWDATSLVVDKKNGRRVFIDVAYNKNSTDFYNVISIARKAIEYMSYRLPGIVFPFPKITVFNGLDEMEYPMMVNDMSFDDPSYVFKLTSHEISHSYFPFMMGINETKYAWMDEGWACFFDYFICYDLDSPDKASVYYLEKYKRDAALDSNVPMMTTSVYLKRPVYHYNSYAKPAVFLFILKDLLGEQLFTKLLHAYVAIWKDKHPIPYDFFYTLNTVTGRNLNWLVQPWFFEYGYADLAIVNVSRESNMYQVIIKKEGHYPVPVYLKATYSDGSIIMVHKNVSVWERGADSFTLELPAIKLLTKLHLDHYLIPDADVSDNIWLLP